MQQLQNLIEVLLEENIYIILITFLNITRCLCIINVENNVAIDMYMEQIMEKLFCKTLNTKKFDIDIAAGILFSLNTVTAKQWLHNSEQEFRARFQKLERVAKLGILFSKQNKLDELPHYTYMYTECLWARYLRKQNIVCDKLLFQEKAKVVMQLILQNDILMAEKFCKMFDINFQFHLPMCIEQVILSWVPNFEVNVNMEGKSVMNMKNNEDDTVKKCIVIAERMELSIVKETLENIRKKANYYYYEMHFCLDVLKERLLQESSPNHILLLYLRNYQRTSPVQKEEKDTWLEVHQNSLDLPAIAEWRLPFWPKVMWRVIRPELTLHTYEQWLLMAGTLKVAEDTIRTIVLKEVVITFKLNETFPSDCDWCPITLEEKVISQIQKCASEIANVEIACAALYHVFRCTKPGMAKVQLAKLCYDLSVKWASSVNNDTANELLENINKMHLDLSTTNILYCHKLGMPCYVNKVSKPEHLIRELYHHPDIVKRNQSLESYCPDINNAVIEIEKVHATVKLHNFLLKLLEDWLTPMDDAHDKFDDTVTMVSNLKLLPNSKQKEKDNFIRASYLLKMNDSNKLLSNLLEIVLANVNEECIKFKYNALICIMSTLSMEDLSSLSGKTPESIRQYLQVLRFISELNSLGYVMTVTQFENYEKSHLVTELMSLGKQNQSVLSLAAQLALRYEIFDAEIWTELLKCMIQWNMPEDLEDIVGKLPATTPGFVEAWTHILFNPIRSCDIPLPDDQRKSCFNCIELVQLCPVSDSVDLLQLGQLCCHLNFPQWAALILPFMCGESQEVLRKRILSRWNIDEIILKLESSEDDFILKRIRAACEEEVEYTTA